MKEMQTDHNNISEHRQELKLRILRTAMPLFKQRGIKAVKMDDIAAALSISKRTLYEVYDKKEDLLLAGARHDHEELLRHIQEYALTAENEIDIVAEKDNRIIVVEVKSRSHPIYDISQVITRDKIRHLINAGNAYVKMFNLPHELQFDVILMVGQDPDNFTVEHIPDAFMAPLRTY